MEGEDMKVLNFIYNGFCGNTTGGYAKYTARFLSWTDDPGIARCECSDGKERLIPTFALEGFDFEANPEPDYKAGNYRIFGTPCRS